MFNVAPCTICLQLMVRESMPKLRYNEVMKCNTVVIPMVNQHNMRAYGNMEVNFHMFVSSALGD